MTGRPGDGCTTPGIHWHWCGFCGAEVWFSELRCARLSGVPGCPRCRETDWRDEVDAIVLG